MLYTVNYVTEQNQLKKNPTDCKIRLNIEDKTYIVSDFSTGDHHHNK